MPDPCVHMTCIPSILHRQSSMASSPNTRESRAGGVNSREAFNTDGIPTHTWNRPLSPLCWHLGRTLMAWRMSTFDPVGKGGWRSTPIVSHEIPSNSHDNMSKAANKLTTINIHGIVPVPLCRAINYHVHSKYPARQCDSMDLLIYVYAHISKRPSRLGYWMYNHNAIILVAYRVLAAPCGLHRKLVSILKQVSSV